MKIEFKLFCRFQDHSERIIFYNSTELESNTYYKNYKEDIG